MAEKRSQSPTMNASQEPDGRPAKRARIFGLDGADDVPDQAVQNEASYKAAMTDQDARHIEKEIASGITVFVNPDTIRFSGLLKKRYTDFHVNEILPNGTVLHLRNLRPPKQSLSHAALDERFMENTKPEVKPATNGSAHESSDVPASSAAIPNGAQNQHLGASEETQTSRKAGDTVISEAKPDGAEALQATATAEISADDKSVLRDLFGEEHVTEIINLYQSVLKSPQRKPRDFKSVFSGKMQRETRTTAHKAVRRIFNSRLETITRDDDTIQFTAASPGRSFHNSAPRQQNQISGKLGWDELGGEYLHFTLFKENKDTMECMHFLATQTKLNIKRFAFGGTKDRRAVTVQRACVHHFHADQLAAIGKRMKWFHIGDYEYRPHSLELGELGGNEFCISLRDCHFPDSEGLDMDGKLKLAKYDLSRTMPAFERDGFLNYYGLQRFGSFQTGTDEVGLKMLQGDLKGAVGGILHYSPTALAAGQSEDPRLKISFDDMNRASAINVWYKTGNTKKALDMLPKKFSAEGNIIRALGSRDPSRANDYQGALMTISRPLRLMYVHAYQSLVWNMVASERWRLFGRTVVEGDLVLVEKADAAGTEGQNAVDESGEPIVRPAADDAAADPDQAFTRARPLSAEEATSGKYTIFDVLLPLPGYDVVYPPNAIGDFYKTFMASERGGGLDPHDMRRPWKDASLSGGYRKLLARPQGPIDWEVKTYVQEEEQLVETDLQKLEKKQGEDRGQSVVIRKEESEESTVPEDAKLAVILRMKLGPSQYATMALRELMGAGGAKTYKPDYGSGRN